MPKIRDRGRPSTDSRSTLRSRPGREGVGGVRRHLGSDLDDDLAVHGQRHRGGIARVPVSRGVDPDPIAAARRERARPIRAQRLTPGAKQVPESQPRPRAQEYHAGWFNGDHRAVAAGGRDPAGTEPDRAADPDASGDHDHPVGGEQLDVDAVPRAYPGSAATDHRPAGGRLKARSGADRPGLAQQRRRDLAGCARTAERRAATGSYSGEHGAQHCDDSRRRGSGREASPPDP